MGNSDAASRLMNPFKTNTKCIYIANKTKIMIQERVEKNFCKQRD